MTTKKNELQNQEALQTYHQVYQTEQPAQLEKQNKKLQGIVVEVLNGDLEKALKKFKKRVANAGIFQDLKNHEAFIKPSERRRREKAQAISREKKRASMEEVGVTEYFVKE